MTASVLYPRGHHTFDVRVNGRLIGSIWRYHDDWLAYRPDMRALGFIFDTADDAIDELKRVAGVDS